MASRAATLPGNLIVFQFRVLPGASRQYPLQARRPEGKKRICTHDQWERAGRGPDMAGDSRELSAGRRVGFGPGGSAALHGWTREDLSLKITAADPWPGPLAWI